MRVEGEDNWRAEERLHGRDNLWLFLPADCNRVEDVWKRYVYIEVEQGPGPE